MVNQPAYSPLSPITDDLKGNENMLGKSVFALGFVLGLAMTAQAQEADVIAAPLFQLTESQLNAEFAQATKAIAAGVRSSHRGEFKQCAEGVLAVARQRYLAGVLDGDADAALELFTADLETGVEFCKERVLQTKNAKSAISAFFDVLFAPEAE